MERDYLISWKAAGISLGLLLILATALVKPLGVSTQYVVSDAAVIHTVAPEFAEENAYLAKYGVKEGWGVGYGWLLVIGMFVGGGIASMLSRKQQPEQDKGSMPPMWKERFGDSMSKRYMAAFGGGVLLLFGARLAGGCTSGHMISGVPQLAVSSFIFAVTGFGAAILMAKFLYRSRPGV
ncbi:MAG: YeeE/YedE thiosulfate transporter family protein [Porticoccaceae bacterium]